MENKYYTPKIEEFHIGFEYEWLDKNNNWIKETTPLEISKNKYEEQKYGLRVKYLDGEDIESLGFKQKWNEHSIISYVNKNNYLIQQYIGILHIEIFNLNIQDDFKSVMFRGEIKNKSDLKALLTQLGIDCEKNK